MSYNLSNDQRRLLNMYISQYDQTSAHIERLTIMLRDIQNNIQQLIRPNSNRYYNTEPLSLDNLLYSNLLRQSQPQLQQRRTNTNANFRDILSEFLSTNVLVRPTEEQITNATRLVRYGSIITPLSISCPISLEPFQDDQMVTQIIHCGHIFCTTELNNWFRTNVRCPVCRYDIREFRRQSNTSTNSTSNATSNTASNTTLNTASNTTSNTNSNTNATSNTNANANAQVSNRTNTTNSNTSALVRSTTRQQINELTDVINSSRINENIISTDNGDFIIYETEIPFSLFNTALSYMRNNNNNNNNI